MSSMRSALKKGLVVVAMMSVGVAYASCPAFLDVTFKRLHSVETVNLCDMYNAKPMLLVNTASHCGFTGQFEGLEALHKGYKNDGLTVIGFASDSFNQAAKSEEEAASVCYKNFGVSFTMLAPTSVKGEEANAVFKYLAGKAQAPKWNFNKYLVTFGEAGSVGITRFDSKVAPMESLIEQAIKRELTPL